MCTITNLKCLLEESTCALRIMVIQRLVYAQILIFSTVDHLQKPVEYRENMTVFPQTSEKNSIPTSFKRQG